MSNEFQENNKFFSMEGTINRRNFITNFLIIEIVESLIITTPLMYLLCFKPDIMGEFLKVVSQEGVYPLSLRLWSLIAGCLDLGLLFPSIVKRIRDITGNEDNHNIVLFVVLIVFSAFFLGYQPVPPVLKQVFSCVSFVVMICLMVMKGKITGEKPKSELIKFNWGAMFGTWVWGLVNKSYLTLLAIPLFFTTGFVPFMIVCGLKGNEWAYKNSDKPIEDFHNSQSTQSAVFTILMPILSILGLLVFLIVGGVSFGKYVQKHPEVIKKLENYSVNMTKTTTESRFSKIEFTDNEYKFYIDPVVWKQLPKSGKLNLFKMTESYVIFSQDEEITNSKDHWVHIKEYNKIKIYSTFNNEILAERNLEESVYKETIEKYKKKEISFREFANIISSGYKFNDNPSLP